MTHFCTPITSSNIDQFSNLFHCQNKEKICNNILSIKIPPSRHYTFLSYTFCFCLYQSSDWLSRPPSPTLCHCRVGRDFKLYSLIHSTVVFETLYFGRRLLLPYLSASVSVWRASTYNWKTKMRTKPKIDGTVARFICATRSCPFGSQKVKG